MKTLIRILPILLIVVACQNPGNTDIDKLVSKRDSLQNEQFKLDKELNTINKQIVLLDTSVNADDAKILKQIAMQKNRLAATAHKIKQLENELSESNEKENLTPVSIKEIVGEPFNHYIIVYGNVEAEDYAMISPEMPGKIEEIYVTAGERVTKGKLLVSLNTSAIDRQIEGLKSGLELATTTFEKQDTLWKQGIGSEIQYLGAKNTKDNLESQLAALQAQKRMAQIRAPFDGIVDKVFSKQGELASSIFPVIEFVNLDKLSITADVSESYIEKVKVGQKIGLSFASLEGYVITAPIRRVSKVIDPASRTFEIELNISNPDKKIKPNMVSTIKINDFSVDDAFVIPSLTIRKDISGNYVYVVDKQDDNDVVVKKYIKTSKSYHDQTLISEGLTVGDKVITKGFHMVSSGVPVRIVE